MLDIVLVGAGGFIGANTRYALTLLCNHLFRDSFPVGTFLINVSGSFILSLFLSLAGRGILSAIEWRWLVAVGFCGGYTTFSTYTYETILLLCKKKPILGLGGYLLGSYILAMLAAFLGWWAGGLI